MRTRKTQRGRRHIPAMAVGIPGAGKEIMNNSLLDDEKSFIVPLIVIGIVVVVVLLIAGLFIPSSISTW
jgi:hypothetical protein